ncbi:MAG: DUF4091 domain-containing protein [Candidatus Hydrogenedentes bacterium]|nr:DUF4091 domain-containing protein [Candidatus Hydrogenedentota bacterium]
MRILCLVFIALLVGLSTSTHAQWPGVPNGDFQTGSGEAPSNWHLSGGTGDWASSVSVTGTGDDTNYWRSELLPFAPSTLYAIRFRMRRIDGIGGTPITGPPFCNRDFGSLGKEWTEATSYFLTPREMSDEIRWLRFGQWQVNGSIEFDDVDVSEVEVVHAHQGAVTLGDGERIDGLNYTYLAPWSHSNSNYTRPLVSHQASFNTNRFNFAPGSDLVFHHEIGGYRQASASMGVQVSHSSGGVLEVETSLDGRQWEALGTLDGEGLQTLSLPAHLFPAESIWIRVRGALAPGADAASGAGGLVIDQYGYEAVLLGEPVTLVGGSNMVLSRNVNVAAVHVVDLGAQQPGIQNKLWIQVDNPPAEGVSITGVVRMTSPSGECSTSTTEGTASPENNIFAVTYEPDLPGTYRLQVQVPELGYAAETDFTISHLHAAHYGQVLPGSTEDLALWWAPSGWKISQSRPAPKDAGAALKIAAARNEAEAAQFVLRPRAGLKQLAIVPGELAGPEGAVLPASAIDVLRVRYVHVAQATDEAGGLGWWPDPLPPLAAPLDLAAGENQPFWVRVNVPADQPAGVYSGAIALAAEGYSGTVPVEIEVYDFTLPTRATCQTAFGFSIGRAFEYQNVTEPEDKRLVWDRYLENLSAHRITPYDPVQLDGLKYHWPEITPELEANPDQLQVQFDWAAWDAALTQAFEHYGFNTINLPHPGLGSGTFHSRSEPELLGYGEESPIYQALFRSYYSQLEAHLAEKGWLDEAYIYWFDEPDPKDYSFVMNGFHKLEAAAPGIRRMLTEQVEPGLVGGPNLWCPILDAFDPETAAPRQAQGEEFWWYVCTGPKAPYLGLFIDRPATDLRAWLWLTYKYNIQGILVWAIDYWSSSSAYPDQPQNPYEDPMGWVSGYSTPSGVRLPWGNGDGRFIYPPEAAADGRPAGPVLEGPVDSVRWEMLRDGIEDYEYFVILKRFIAEKGEKLSPEEKAGYEALLQVPESVAVDPTHYNDNPGPMNQHRDDLARAIGAIQ